jgi:hypothetical protein
LYDQANVPAETLTCAKAEATRLFRAAGIRIAWERPSSEAPEDRGIDMTSPACQRSDNHRYIVVRLQRRTPANICVGALGFALPFAHTGAHVSIFYDRVEALVQSVNIAAYVILGHAMAHEIGHVLLGSSEHSEGGLMQGCWTGELAFGRGGPTCISSRRCKTNEPSIVEIPTLAVQSGI